MLKRDEKGRRLFLGKEFYDSGNSMNGKYQTKISEIQNKIKINGIIDDKVFKTCDLKHEESVALSKSDFAELVENDKSFIEDFDFSTFKQIFDIINSIIKN